MESIITKLIINNTSCHLHWFWVPIVTLYNRRPCTSASSSTHAKYQYHINIIHIYINSNLCNIWPGHTCLFSAIIFTQIYSLHFAVLAGNAILTRNMPFAILLLCYFTWMYVFWRSFMIIHFYLDWDNNNIF